MSKVLITGGTGYIGSHTVVEFIEAGYKVVIVDNLSNSNIEVLDGIEKITGIKPEFFKIDLANKEEITEFFKQQNDFDVIIHFAAYKAVGESVEKPIMYYQNNLNSLMNVMQGMMDYSINNLIFSSSCTVYGEPDILPVSEKAPIKKANSPYGNTKQIAEEIIQDIIKANKNINSISLRYFNPIGAHHSAEIGELPIGVPNNLIPYITQTVIGLRKKLYVFGKDYNTPDGTAIRDYIHVVDLAKAHLVAAERLISEKNKQNFEIFNLGSGKGYSVLEIIEVFEKVTGEKINYEITERREGDVEKVWADPKLANEELNWKTELSIEEALKSAWEWQKNIMK